MARRKTHKEFIEQVNQLTNGEYVVLESYVNNSTKILFKHNINTCGYEFKTKPNTFLNGCRCPKCAKENNAKTAKIRAKRKTHEEFIEEVFSLSGSEYSVLGKYVSAKEKILFKHNNDECNNTFHMSPSDFLSGERCPFCKGNRISLAKRKTLEQFKSDVYNLVGNDYLVKSNNYKNAHTKINFIHNVEGCNKEFQMTPNTFLSGNGCPHCRYINLSNIMRKSQEQFENDVKNLKGDEYSVMGEYIDSKTKIKMLHNKCGRDFNIFPSWFLQGYGCTHCTNEELLKNKTKSQEEFEHEIKELTNNEYSVVGKYINTQTKISLKHNCCNTIFEVTPTMFLSSKTRCPICTKNSNGEVSIRHCLNDMNIQYNNHKTFPDLFGTGGGHLSYDFYIPSLNILIEYQGKQHNVPIKYFGGEERFKIQKIHDDIKRLYAKEHNIKLLEIWYWDFDNIKTILQNELNFEDIVVG